MSPRRGEIASPNVFEGCFFAPRQGCAGADGDACGANPARQTMTEFRNVRNTARPPAVLLLVFGAQA